MQWHVARTSVVRQLVVVALQVAMGEMIGHHRLMSVEKGKSKKLATKKRKASDREGEVAEAVAAAAEAAERGGCSGALRIGSDLMPA